MNDSLDALPLGPNAPLGELLLAGTAIRIELPPSLHRLAVSGTRRSANTLSGRKPTMRQGPNLLSPRLNGDPRDDLVPQARRWI